MARFDDDRPLTARSVLVSSLLGEQPPQLPVSQLVNIGALFGMTENRTRVALSRMVAAGELTTCNSVYRLSSKKLLERQDRQIDSVRGQTETWDGRWTLVVLTGPATSASQRQTRRMLLTKARLAEQRDGVWLRPNNLGTRISSALNDLDAEMQWYECRPETASDVLARELFGVSSWAARAEQLIDRLSNVKAQSSIDLAPGFVLSASVLRHLQGDPLLPRELLPKHWPGSRLRRDYAEWNHRYRRLLTNLAHPTG